jgi:hypothetical protein
MEACTLSITRPAAGLIRTQRPEMCDSAVKDEWMSPSLSFGTRKALVSECVRIIDDGFGNFLCSSSEVLVYRQLTSA